MMLRGANRLPLRFQRHCSKGCQTFLCMRVSPTWRRDQSNTTAGARNTPASRDSFWTTGRTLLFSAFVGSLAYVYGVADTRSYITELKLWKNGKTKEPQYGSAKELDKVSSSL